MAESTDLAQALISAVQDMKPGLRLLISIVCYVLALAAFMQGLMRVLKTSEDKFHAPSGMGTALSFLICVILLWLPSWLSAAGNSLFGAGHTAAAATLGYGGGGGTRYDELLKAVFSIVSAVGLLAFIKGAYVLRAAADGRSGASTGAGFAHMAGGIAGWHIVSVVGAVQNTLGIHVLNIQ